MFNKYLSVAVLTLSCLSGSSITARAQDCNSIVVNIPFEFVAGTNVLPAGRYSVERVSHDSDSALVIHGHDNSVFLLPIVFDEVSGGQTNVRFEQVGNKHFLRKVETPGGAYTIAISRRMTNAVMVNSDGTSSPAGAN
jgi:hypothetical protein